MQDAPKSGSLLGRAYAKVLRDMMQWRYIDNPPPGYREEKQQVEGLLAQKLAMKAEAAARKAARPPAPLRKPSAAPVRHDPSRQSKSIANRKLSGKEPVRALLAWHVWCCMLLCFYCCRLISAGTHKRCLKAAQAIQLLGLRADRLFRPEEDS